MPESYTVVALLLAGLTYGMVSCVLTILAVQRKHALDVYDRVRDSKRLRQEYLTALQNKSNQY
jgi:hypothetical protein